MTKEFISHNKAILDSEYVTTSELAELCGVSRFTIINWVKQGKIKSVKTIGGHRRIPHSEVVSILQALEFNKEKEVMRFEPVPHCWQYAEKVGCDKQCKDCVTFKKKIDYCFFVMQEYGKEEIRCEGNCLECGYFQKIFYRMKMLREPDGGGPDITKEAITKKRSDFLNNVSYSVGHGILDVKKKIYSIRHELLEKVLNSKKRIVGNRKLRLYNRVKNDKR